MQLGFFFKSPAFSSSCQPALVPVPVPGVVEGSHNRAWLLELLQMHTPALHKGSCSPTKFPNLKVPKERASPFCTLGGSLQPGVMWMLDGSEAYPGMLLSKDGGDISLFKGRSAPE